MGRGNRALLASVVVRVLDLAGDAAAIGDVVAVRARPVADRRDLDRVTARRPAGGAFGTHGGRGRAAPGLDAFGDAQEGIERGTELRRVLAAQVGAEVDASE